MFGTNYHHQGSERGLDDAGLLFEAMTTGRSAPEREAAGAMGKPDAIVVDSRTVSIDGRPQELRQCMRFAVAACRHGDKDFLRGLLSLPSMFNHPSHADWRESMEFAHEPLALSCAGVLLARGDFESLGVLSSAAHAKIASTKDPKPGWRRDDSQACSFLELDQKQAENLFWQLAYSKALKAEQFNAGFDWIRSRCHSNLASKAPALWLDAATQSGSELALESALSMGAIPSPQDVVRAAGQGGFETAVRMAKIAKPGAVSRHGRGDSEKNASVCGSLASSLLGSLPDLALRMSEWRDPKSTSMESGLYSYVRNRANLHRGAELALEGALDLPGEDPAALELFKNQIASAIRALCLASFPGLPEVDPKLASRLRPDAPVTFQELQFLATCSPDRLPAALDRADQNAGEKFCEMAIRRHLEAEKHKGYSSRSHPEASKTRSEELAKRAEQALFEIFQRDSALIGPSSHQALMTHLRKYEGVAEAFEREAISRSTQTAVSRSRGPLKA
jgi:hypothetical protein